MKISLIFALPLLLFTACFGPVKSTVRHYDLGVDAPVVNIDCDIEVSSPFGVPMLIRSSTHEVEYDTENLWIAPPATMLRNYLAAATAKAKPADGKRSVLNVRLFRFEYDLMAKNGSLGVEWVFTDPSVTEKGRYKVIAQGRNLYVSPAQESPDPAAALAHCAAQFAKDLKIN